MKYIKKFNNNVALAEDQEKKEWILIGKGISFNKQEGDKIYDSEIDRRFLAEPSKDFSYIVQTIFTIDSAVIEAVNEMIEVAEKKLGFKFREKSYLTLVDHIDFALKRMNEGLEYSEPVKWETRRLHPLEYKTAVYCIHLLNERLKIQLPKSEETFITLHFVNAQSNQKSNLEADRVKLLVNRMMNFVSSEYDLNLDVNSIDYIRFVTHLRYFIIRQMNNESLKVSDLDKDFLHVVKEKYNRAYQTAIGIGEKMRREEGWNISDNEIMFLTIHIWRVTQPENELPYE